MSAGRYCHIHGRDALRWEGDSAQDSRDRSNTDPIATNPWQVSYHPSGMRPVDDPGRRCPRTLSAVALFDDRRTPPRPPGRGGLRALLLLTVAAALPPAPAYAGPAVGSAASGRVEISVSVGPRYQVLAAEALDAASVRRGIYSNLLCLATNSSAPTLPVLLVRPLVLRPELPGAGAREDLQLIDGTAAGIGRCAATNGKSVSRAANADYRTAGQLLLVRPE